MKLEIEPPETKQNRLLEVEDSINLTTHILDLQIQRQVLSNWCWAAIAASLSDYYNMGNWAQHEVASKLLAFDCTGFNEDPALAKCCNIYAMLDDALQIVGCYSHWSPDRPVFERIQAEIDAGRPIC